MAFFFLLISIGNKLRSSEMWKSLLEFTLVVNFFSCRLLTDTPTWFYVSTLFFHSSIQLFVHQMFAEPLLCENPLRCQGFLSKTKIWPDTALLLSMTSHCRLQAAGHAPHVLAHLHVSVRPVSLSGLFILMVQMVWNVPSSPKLPPDLSWLPSPHAGILLFLQCSHRALHQLCYWACHLLS